MDLIAKLQVPLTFGHPPQVHMEDIVILVLSIQFLVRVTHIKHTDLVSVV